MAKDRQRESKTKAPHADNVASIVPVEHIASRILLVRGQKVVLDSDLAALYGVTTARLNEQVKRNIERFPEDFAFRLTTNEFANLMSHFATSSSTWGGRRKPPCAFTEHGAIMAASVRLGLVPRVSYLVSGPAGHNHQSKIINNQSKRPFGFRRAKKS